MKYDGYRIGCRIDNGSVTLLSRSGVETRSLRTSGTPIASSSTSIPVRAVAWPGVIQAARLVRRSLEAVGLASFVKNTGGRGLHAVVPLRPERNWSECLPFSRGLPDRIAAEDPSAFTTTFAKKGEKTDPD
jgi:hypothetical protein